MIVGTSWVFLCSVIQTLLSWPGEPVGKKCKNILLAALLCLFWTLWWEMNRVAFENGVTSGQRIKATFSLLLFFCPVWFSLVYLQCTSWNRLVLFLINILLFTDKKIIIMQFRPIGG